MIELNKSYTSEELAKELGLPISVFKRFRQEILNYLFSYYILYIGSDKEDKRKTAYTFLYQFEDFPGYSRTVNMSIQPLVMEIIENGNIVTNASISHIIYDKTEGLDLSVIATTVNKIVYNMENELVLARKINDFQYEELNEQEQKNFDKIWHGLREVYKTKVDVYMEEDISNRMLRQKLIKAGVERWLQTFKKFKEEYGYAVYDGYLYKKNENS